MERLAKKKIIGVFISWSIQEFFFLKHSKKTRTTSPGNTKSSFSNLCGSRTPDTAVKGHILDDVSLSQTGGLKNYFSCWGKEEVCREWQTEQELLQTNLKRNKSLIARLCVKTDTCRFCGAWSAQFPTKAGADLQLRVTWITIIKAHTSRMCTKWWLTGTLWSRQSAYVEPQRIQRSSLWFCLPWSQESAHLC